MIRVLLISSFCIFTSVLFGQYTEMEVLTTEDGLLSNQIQDIGQDSSGYIWVVSSDGLSRYNGTTFRHYRNEEFTSMGFKPGHAMRLYSDNQGGIWTSTASGAIISYAPEQDRFIIRNDTTTRLPAAGISYLQDSLNNLWIGTLNEGLCYWDRQKGSLRVYRQYDHADSLSDNLITDVSPGYESGVLTISTTKGNCLLSIAEGKFYRRWYRSENQEDTYKHNVIRDFLETRDAYYAATFGGLHVTRKSDFFTKHYFANGNQGLNYNSLWAMIEADDGRIWIATYGGGINIFDPETNRFSYITKANSSLPEDNLRHIFRDRDGSIWVITDNTGLIKMDARKKWILSYDFKNLNIDGVIGIHSSPDSVIYIGANGGGLVRLDIRTGRTDNQIHDPSDPATIAYDHVSSVDRDGSGNLWVGTAGGGLDYFDRDTGKFNHFKFKAGEPSIPENAISTLRNTDSVLWYGTYRTGFGTYDPNSRVFSTYTFPYNSYDQDLEVTNIRDDTQGRVWIMHTKGVVLHDKIRAEFVDLISPYKAEMPVDQFYFRGFAQLPSGDVLLLNSNNTLLRVQYNNPSSVSFEKIRMPEGLIRQYELHDILEVSDSVLWFVEREGLVRWSMGSRMYEVFDKDDGLRGNEFYRINRTGSGPTIVASDEAIHVVDLEAYYSIQTGPVVHLEDLSILNRPVQINYTDSVHNVSLPKHIDLMHDLDLDYGHREFSIEFAALQFYSPGAASYRYRLKGFNDEWLDNGSATKVSYTNLDPGSYIFEVQASLAPDVWGPVKALNIRIDPPFWKTWYFLSAMVMLAALLLYLLHRYRLQKALAIANLRNQIAQDLHDDIGSSLTKISLYSSLLQDEGKENHQNGFLVNIGDLSREVIGQMSDIVWSVDQKNDTAGNLISRMREFASETLEACDISLDFRAESINAAAFVDPLFRQNFYLIFKEAINNICKHAEARRVEVHVSGADGKYYMRIVDNGKGIAIREKVLSGKTDKAFDEFRRETHGNGLGNMRKRASRIGMTFEIISGLDGGTVITVK